MGFLIQGGWKLQISCHGLTRYLSQQLATSLRQVQWSFCGWASFPHHTRADTICSRKRCAPFLPATKLHTHFATTGCVYICSLKSEWRTNLQAANQGHIQAGFRGAGLYSFNPSAIHAEKLALPLPEDCPGDNTTTPQQPLQEGPTMASGSTDHIVPTATPLKVYLRNHFTAVLQRSRPTRQRQTGQVSQGSIEKY